MCRPPDQIRCKCICHFPRSSRHRGEAFRLRVVLLDADLRLLGHGCHAAAPVLAEEDEQFLRPFERVLRLGVLRVREAKCFCLN